MKKLILTAIAVFVAAICFAQESKDTTKLKSEISKTSKTEKKEIKTLFGKPHSFGAYIGFNTGYSQIDGKDAMISGGRLSFVMNHSFAIGFGGNGFVNDLDFDENFNPDFTAGGYGGVILEPIIGGRFPVHASIPILIGAGGVSSYSYHVYNNPYWYESPVDVDAFLIVEPGMDIELNILKFFRIGFGASYKYTTDVNLDNRSSKVLHGLNYNITFKLGKF